MKPITICSFLLTFLISLIVSCKEIIEADISDRKIVLNSPGDRSQSKDYTMNFWWDEVEDALTYRLQVVTPDFDRPASLILDTIVKSPRFTTSLSPGEYTWRVRAENGHSQTPYSASKSFTVLFSSIKQQKVRVISPSNGALLNNAKISLNWENLYGATKYRLQLDTNNFLDTNKLFLDISTPVQQFDLSLTKDQTYQWRIRAENDTARSLWSSVNNFVFDRTPPAQVVLTSPLNDQAVPSPVSLQWTSVSTASKYKLYLFKTDSVTNYSASYPMVVTSTTQSIALGTMGERVYWKVSAIDAAGNEGKASKLRNFTVQ